MCGIVGIVRFNGQSVRPEEIAAMSRSIAHRGPDDEGQLVVDGVGIGMRRRKVVDNVDFERNRLRITAAIGDPKLYAGEIKCVRARPAWMWMPPRLLFALTARLLSCSISARRPAGARV